MKREQLSGNTDGLGHPLLRLISQTPSESHTELSVALEWSEHLMMDRCIERLEQIVGFPLLLKSFVGCYVCEVYDLTLPVIET